MRQYMPSRRRTIWIRGWEPLGNLCQNDGPRSEATPYASIEPTDPNYGTGVWHGTWGKHYHTPNNLLLRANARWNMWSDNWTTFDYVLFAGAKIYIPQPRHNGIMITFDPYLQTKILSYQEKNVEDAYIHPGILLNMPHTHIIMPFTMKHKPGMYKIRVKPPPGWSGYQRFPEAMGYILYHWGWTWFSFNTAFFNSFGDSGTDQCPIGPWWATNNYLDKWVNRMKYDTATTTSKTRTWGPFLPPKIDRGTEESVFFFYKIKLRLSGDSIWRPVPTSFVRDGLVPEPGGPTTTAFRSKAKKHSKGKKRPQDIFDILPGDLDSDGILKEGAYHRITADHPANKRRRVEDARRIGSLYDRVYNILTEFNLVK